MPIIIAARYQLKEQAELTADQLTRSGFAAGKVAAFYVNPPGQHAVYPIGGDRYQSPGFTKAEAANSNDSTGVAMVEAVIGAHTNEKSARPAHENGDTVGGQETSVAGDNIGQNDALAPIRRAGMMVAVELDDRTDQNKAINLLAGLGGEHIEIMEGNIVDAEWHDFDPLSQPSYI